MHYELNFYEEFIEAHFSSASAPSSVITEFKSLVDRLHGEAKTLKKRMICRVFELQNTEQQSYYIRHHQAALISFAERLNDWLSAADCTAIYALDKKASIKNLAKHCYRNIEELLFFIETRFNDYFDRSMTMPRIYRIIAASGIDDKVSHVKTRFRELGVEPTFAGVVLEPLSAFTDAADRSHYSYAHLHYFNRLTAALVDLLSGDDKDLLITLSGFLVKWNFNSEAAYDWYTQHYLSVMEAADATEEKRHHLLDELRELNHLVPLQSTILDTSRPDLKQSLLDWLEDEIHHLERQIRRLPVPSTHGDQEVEKIPLALTVPQLGHLLRLFIETGLHPDLNPSVLLRFYARYYASRFKGDISAESLRQKYYASDAATASSVRDLLLKMTHYSKKMMADT